MPGNLAADLLGIERIVRKRENLTIYSDGLSTGGLIMVDSDLAMLYQVETKALNRAVKRNIKRFPEDFCFQLTTEEVEALRCQFDTSKYKN